MRRCDQNADKGQGPGSPPIVQSARSAWMGAALTQRLRNGYATVTQRLRRRAAGKGSAQRRHTLRTRDVTVEPAHR